MADEDKSKNEFLVQIRTADDLPSIFTSVGNKLVVMEFWADWCYGCKIFLPILQTIAAQYQDVVFLQVNVDDLGELASNYEVTHIPTVLFFKNGTVIECITSPDEKKIIDTIELNKYTNE